MGEKNRNIWFFGRVGFYYIFIFCQESGGNRSFWSMCTVHFRRSVGPTTTEGSTQDAGTHTKWIRTVARENLTGRVESTKCQECQVKKKGRRRQQAKNGIERKIWEESKKERTNKILCIIINTHKGENGERAEKYVLAHAGLVVAVTVDGVAARLANRCWRKKRRNIKIRIS